ncbi:hypothetical protein [Weissella thailandensis]|nr:hypothetical protein [Weissella thailandensis]GEP75031.1 hypothetical protein WTH01_12780 [Weissella thailandensis]
MQKKLRSSSDKLDKNKTNTITTKETRLQTVDNGKSNNNYHARFSDIKKI